MKATFHGRAPSFRGEPRLAATAFSAVISLALASHAAGCGSEHAANSTNSVDAGPDTGAEASGEEPSVGADAPVDAPAQIVIGRDSGVKGAIDDAGLRSVEAGFNEPYETGSIPPFVDPFDGAVGCDASITAPDQACALVLPLDGSVSSFVGWPTVNGWGAAPGGSTLEWWLTTGTSASTVVDLSFANAPSLGSSGPQPPAFLRVEALQASQPLPDAPRAGWTTPLGACNVSFTSNACAPFVALPDRYVVAGKGSCTEPAAPDLGNDAGPLTIGDFYFVAQF